MAAVLTVYGEIVLGLRVARELPASGDELANRGEPRLGSYSRGVVNLVDWGLRRFLRRGP